MNCKRCGNLLNVGDVVCPHCGEAVSNNVIQQSVNNGQTQGVTQVTSVTNEVLETVSNYNEVVNQPINNMNQVSNNQMVMNQGLVNSVPNNSMPLNQGNIVNNMQQDFSIPVQMQPINVQQGVNQNNFVGNESKKKDISFIVIVIVLIVVIMGLSAYIGYRLIFSNKVETKEVSKNSNKNDVVSNSNDNKVDDKSKENEKEIVSIYGYSFEIPDTMRYTIDSDILTISDGSSYQATLTIGQYNIDVIEEDMQAMEDVLVEEGFISIDSYIKEVNGHSFICFEGVFGGNKGIFYFTNFGNGRSVFGFGIVKDNKSYDVLLKNIDSLLSTVTVNTSFSSNTEEMEVDFLDLFIMDNLLE